MIEFPEHYREDRQERAIDEGGESLCHYCGRSIRRKWRIGTDFCTNKCSMLQTKADNESARLEREIQDTEAGRDSSQYP